LRSLLFSFKEMKCQGKKKSADKSGGPPSEWIVIGIEMKSKRIHHHDDGKHEKPPEENF
jgi:hypothetical protein